MKQDQKISLPMVEWGFEFRSYSIKPHFKCLYGEGNGNLLQYSCQKIPWMEEPGRLQSMGLLRVRHDWELHFHFSLSCIGERNGNPLQCFCLENPRDGRGWWATIYGVAQSRTWMKWLSSSGSSKCLCQYFPKFNLWFNVNYLQNLLSTNCDSVGMIGRGSEMLHIQAPRWWWWTMDHSLSTSISTPLRKCWS